MPIFGRRKQTFPIPAILPKTCPNCGARLDWVPVVHFDETIGLEKVDHYKAECACGEVHYRDGRGQVVEPAVANLPPDRSDFANSPQGPQPYSGYTEFVQQERVKAEALKAAQAKKAADAAAAAAGGATPAATTARPEPGSSVATQPAAPVPAAPAPAAPAAQPAAPAAESRPVEAEAPQGSES